MGRFRLVCSLALAFGFTLSSLGFGKALSLSELQRILKERGASWKAGATSVSRLTPSEQRMKLGADVDNEVVFSHPKSGTRPTYPASWDWRSKDGVNYMSHLMDQGRCGSCVAFAVIGALETQMNITYKAPTSPWALSPQHLFSCGGGECAQGWTVGSAMSFLKDDGVPSESCFPYTSGAKGEDVACSKTCKESGEKNFKISTWNQPTFLFSSNEKIKAALMNGPLVASMTVYEDFFYYTDGVYKHVTGDVAGGHALMLIGWSDAEKAWIGRNSWGPNWGEEGYFKIAYSDSSGITNSTYRMYLPSSHGFVTIAGITDRKAVSGTVDLRISSTFAGTKSTSWTVTKGGAAVLSGQGVFESQLVADGVYEIQAMAEHTKGKSYSDKKTLHVLNGGLAGSIGFDDLVSGKKLSGDQELGLTLTASPVPFDRVIFRKKNVATGALSERGTTNVADAMNVGWRTKGVANGNYELTLIGQTGGREVSSVPVIVEISN